MKALNELNLQVLLERELNIGKEKENNSYFPIQLITTHFELHFVLRLPNPNTTQANSTPKRTMQCEHTHTNHEIKNIIQKEAM